MTAPEGTPPPQRKRRLGLWVGLGVGAVALLVAAGSVLVTTTTVLDFVSGHRGYEITSRNMEPTLEPGDRVLADTVAKGHYTPRRGDIVVFTAPAGWDTSGQTGKHISRVVAVPQDTISCPGGGEPPAIDGRSLDEPYARGGCGPIGYTAKVPPGRLWLMGDNRANSYDSRIVYLQTQDLSAATVPTTAVVAVIKK